MLIRAEVALHNNMIFLGTASRDALIRFLLSPRRLPNAGVDDIDRAIALGLDSPGLRRQAAHIAILAATGSSQEIDRALRRLERQYLPRKSSGSLRSQSFIVLLGRALHAGLVTWARDERLLHRAAQHLERAVELGLDPAALEQEAVWNPLWAQSRFRTLLKTRPSLASPVVETRTVDPTPDAHF